MRALDAASAAAVQGEDGEQTALRGCDLRCGRSGGHAPVKCAEVLPAAAQPQGRACAAG